MRKSGFTLIELIIAMAVGAVIMTAIWASLNLAARTSSSTDRKVITQQDARAVLDIMAMEIRMASYNPQDSGGTWSSVDALGCIDNAPVTSRGIRIANANSIGVAMDLNGNETIGDAPNEYIVYSYNGADSITRRVRCQAATAILGGTAPFSNVRNTEAGVSLFRYFWWDPADGVEKEILPANLPAQTPNIRRIMITIVADNAQADPGAAAPRRMIYSTNIIVRNHALSP